MSRHRNRSRDNRHNNRQIIKEGEEYDGIVSRVVDYGCFIKLGDGREGLCHIRNMG